MKAYKVVVPGGVDYRGWKYGETLIAYVSSREVVQQILDNLDSVLDVYEITIRDEYNESWPRPTEKLVYGAYRTIPGKYVRGWLDQETE